MNQMPAILETAKNTVVKCLLNRFHISMRMMNSTKKNKVLIVQQELVHSFLRKHFEGFIRSSAFTHYLQSKAPKVLIYLHRRKPFFARRYYMQKNPCLTSLAIAFCKMNNNLPKYIAIDR